MQSERPGDQKASQQSCKRIVDGNTNTALYALVTYRPSPYGEIEEGDFDIVLTDGAQTWAGEGVGSAALKPATPNRVRHSLEALTDLFPPSEDYTCELNYDVDEPPELWAKWTSRHGKGLTLTVRLPLRPVEHSGRHVSAMLDALLSNLQSVRSSAARLEEQCRDWRGAAERAQGVVEEYVAQRAQQERDTSEKVAALLNSKKRRLREVQRELVDLRARVGALPSTSADQGGGSTLQEASAPSGVVAPGGDMGHGAGPREDSMGDPMAVESKTARGGIKEERRGEGAEDGGEQEDEGGVGGADVDPQADPDRFGSPPRE